MADTPVKIHSVGEAYLLLMVTSCAECGKGPLEAVSSDEVDLGGASGRRLQAVCKACGRQQELVFDLTHVADGGESAGPDALPRINPTDEPSRAIDLAQWLMLFEAIIRKADEVADPAVSRRLGYEAAQCLEEALKFYGTDGGEWPDEAAFFHPWTRRRFREHRQVFARTRLVEMRGRLPSLGRMEQRLTAPATATRAPDKRRWWAFWRR